MRIEWLMDFRRTIGCLTLLLATVAKAQKSPDVLDLLEKAEANLRWESLVSIDSEITAKENKPNNSWIRRGNLVYHRNDEITQWISQSNLLNAEEKNITEGDDWEVEIISKERQISARKPPGSSIATAFIRHQEYKSRQHALITSSQYGAFLEGHLDSADGATITKLLASSKDLAVKSEVNIDGLQTYEITGSTNFGNIRLWVAPARGYAPIQYEVMIEPQHLISHMGTSEKVGDLRKSKLVVKIQSFQNINGQWIGSSGVMSITNNNIGPEPRDIIEVKRTKIDTNPDFKSLAAFELKLPEGSKVFDDLARGIRFEYRHGQLVPFTDDSAIMSLDSSLAEITAVNSTVQPNSPTTLPTTTATVANNSSHRNYTNLYMTIIFTLIAISVGVIVYFSKKHRKY